MISANEAYKKTSETINLKNNKILSEYNYILAHIYEAIKDGKYFCKINNSISNVIKQKLINNGYFVRYVNHLSDRPFTIIDWKKPKIEE